MTTSWAAQEKPTSPRHALNQYEEMRMDRGWPTPNHMRDAADALDMLVIPKYGDVLRWFADLCDADGEREAAAAAIWDRLEAEPGFNEELVQARADIAAGKGTPWREAAAATPSLDVEQMKLAIRIVADDQQYDLAYSREAYRLANDALNEYARLRARLAEGSATPDPEER